MKMSKLIVSLMIAVAVSSAGALVLTGCSSGVAERQGVRPSGEARPLSGPSVYKIMYQLELAEEQIPGVRAVLEDAEEKLGALAAGFSGQPDPSMMASIQAQIQSIEKETESQLKVILTGEQMERYREMMEEARKERERMRSEMGRGGGRPGGMRGGR